MYFWSVENVKARVDVRATIGVTTDSGKIMNSQMRSLDEK